MKVVIFGDEAKEQIFEGAEMLYKAVSTTLGPKGRTLSLKPMENQSLPTTA